MWKYVTVCVASLILQVKARPYREGTEKSDFAYLHSLLHLPLYFSYLNLSSCFSRVDPSSGPIVFFHITLTDIKSDCNQHFHLKKGSHDNIKP